jgi:hypothetical protein
MFRTSLGLCGVLFLSLATYGCSGDESSGVDAAVTVSTDGGGEQMETGTGVGRARGAGGLDEADAGLIDAAKGNADAATTDALLPKADAAVTADAGLSCESKCTSIRTRYVKAVSAAKSCRTTSRAQCEVSVASDLFCAGCNEWVNDSSVVSAVAKDWDDAGCGTCDLGKCLRPLKVCLATTGACKPSTAFATVPGVGNITVVDPGIVVLPNDGACMTVSPGIQPL